MKSVKYSAKELKDLFGGKKVSPQLNFDFEEVKLARIEESDYEASKLARAEETDYDDSYEASKLARAEETDYDDSYEASKLARAEETDYDDPQVARIEESDYESDYEASKLARIEEIDYEVPPYITETQSEFPTIIQNNQITLSETEENYTHILKPMPIAEIDYREEVPANEQLTMRIAKEIYGIKTIPNNLCFTLENQPVYISQKTDLEYVYENINSYEELATEIQNSVPTWMIAIDELFKRVLFNYIYGNDQANIKDFGFIVKNDEVLLSPAYNLINTALHTDNEIFTLEDGLSEYINPSDVYQETGYPCKTDFIQFGEAIGLPQARIERTLNMFLKFQDEVFEMINDSYLSTDTLKQKYLKVIKERKVRLTQESC